MQRESKTTPAFEKCTSITDAELIARAISNSRGRDYRKGKKHERWIAVMDTFVLGSTTARALCIKYGFHPDEMVAR